MEIDVIILSYAKNDSYVHMNNQCINSIINSTNQHHFNIYLIETDANKNFNYTQKEVIVIQPGGEFNYNKFLNIGFEQCKNNWILISNNDTIYEKNFIEHMLKAHDIDNELISMSPRDGSWHRQKPMNEKLVYYGYRLQFELSGWSIFIHRKVLDIIGKFDENYTYWYQDTEYRECLKKHKIKHALVSKAGVKHLVEKSKHLVTNWNEMANNSEKYFIEKWKVSPYE